MAPPTTKLLVNRIVSAIIPALLLGCIGFAVYVVTKRICVDYFLNTRGRTKTGVVLLVFHFIFLFIELSAYARLIATIQFDPGLVPRGEKYTPSTKKDGGRQSRRRNRNRDDIEAQPYDETRPHGGRDVDPNSPGLERFYSKDVFICDNDGFPRWCSSCMNWKYDRVHHSSDMDRCVRKMDHYCPWVSGIISENSFKFFVQFVFYTTLYCIVCLVASVLCLRDQQRTQHPIDGTTYAIIALAAFFGLFTFSMTTVSLQYIFANLTNVEFIRKNDMVFQVAMRVPNDMESTEDLHVISYPLPEPGQENILQSARDRLATRKFAVVRTQKGENPWDVGVYNNWKAVMGTNIVDWMLPIRKSPCCYEENNASFYRMGPLYKELRQRYSLPLVDQEGRATRQEMQQVRGGGRI